MSIFNVLYDAYLNSDSENKPLIFDQYAMALLNSTNDHRNEFQHIINNDKEKFFDEFSTYLESHSDTTRSVNVLKTILQAIRNQKINKTQSTKFVWKFKGFRSLVKYYPKSLNGHTAMSDSIFCSITDPYKLMTDINNNVECFKDLINDQAVREYLLRHIDDIFTDNIGYTYDDPHMANSSTLSTLDFLVLCLNIFVQILKERIFDNDQNSESNNQINESNAYIDDENIKKVFWKAINVVYASLFVIYDSIARSLKESKKYFAELSQNQIHQNELQSLKIHIQKGKDMLKKQDEIMNCLDKKYIENLIYEPSMLGSLLMKKEYNILSRVMDCIVNRNPHETYLPRVHVSRKKLVLFVLMILDEKTCPLHIKFSVMNFILDNQLNKYLFEENPNTTYIITKYILNDIQKLKDNDMRRIFHSLDVMISFCDTSIINSEEIVEMYMYHIPEFNNQYVNILKSVNKLGADMKSDAVKDLIRIADMSLLLIKEFPTLGRLSLSYLGDMLSLLETISNTKQIIMNNNYFDSFVEKAKTIVNTMLDALISQSNLIIDTNSERILKDVLNIDFAQLWSTSSERKVSILTTDKMEKISYDVKEIMDVIKCDVAINPFYIKTGDGSNRELHLVDRKTVHSMYISKINPFTREYIDKQIIDEFNQTEEILSLRAQVLDKINKL